MSGDGAAGGPSRDLVISAYQLLLGREPESDVAIDSHRHSVADRRALVKAFLESPEFQLRNPGAIATPVPMSRLFAPMSVELDPNEDDLRRLMQRVASTWRALGEERPHWSVLSLAQYLPENIESRRAAFHETGANDVEQLLDYIRHVGRDPAEFASVLEYGCGVGRMTNHFARRFSRVVACDISASHLALARDYSATLGLDNITYREITAPEFGMTEPIDLWYSMIVLQHSPPPVMAAIVRRMLHMLRPGGLAVFQAPTYEPNYRFSVSDYLRSPGWEGLEMHILPQREVFRLVRDAGCTLYDVFEDSRAGPERLSNVFVIGK